MSSKFGTSSRTIAFDKAMVEEPREEVLVDRAKVLNTISSQLDKIEHPTETVNKLQHRATTLWRELHDLGEGSQPYTEAFDRRIEEVVMQFNELQTNTAPAFDEKPKPAAKQAPAKPKSTEKTETPEKKEKKVEPEDDTASSNDSTGLSSNDADRLAKVERRLDGHDRRFENAERNLDALNGAVGITERDGAWLPIPDGQFDRNAKVQQYLGYNRDGDGNITFDEPEPTDARHPLRWGIGAIFGVPLTVVLYIIFGAIFGWTGMILPCLGAGALVTLVVAWNAPAKKNDQPRG